MRVEIRLVSELLQGVWGSQVVNNLRVEILGGAVLKQLLFFFVKHDHINVLAAEKAQLYDLFQQAPSPLAEGHIPLVLVLN